MLHHIPVAENAANEARGSSQIIKFAGLSLIEDQMTLSGAGYSVYLTEMEFLVLKELMLHSAQTVPKSVLGDLLYGSAVHPKSRTIETIVWKIRRKVSLAFGEVIAIVTDVEAGGYRMTTAKAPPASDLRDFPSISGAPCAP